MDFSLEEWAANLFILKINSVLFGDRADLKTYSITFKPTLFSMIFDDIQKNNSPSKPKHRGYNILDR